MKRAALIALASSVFLIAGCGAAGSDRGFDVRESSGPTTHVAGRALGDEGEPSAGTDVYLHVDDQKFHAQTESDGAFAFEEVPPGPAKLVLNDGSGSGALRETELIADGTNDLGSITLRALGDYPKLVDIHGVGFEERVTTGDGGYKFPLYDDDADKVYAARRQSEDDDAAWTVLEIDTETGRERELVRDQTLSKWYGVAPIRASSAFKLAADRYLVWKYGRSEGHGSGLRIYDLKRDELAYDTSSIGEQIFHRHVPVTDEAIVMPMEMGLEPITSPEGGLPERDAARRIKFYKFDVDTGEVVEGPDAASSWIQWFQFRDYSDSALAYRVTTACRGDGEWEDQFVACTPEVEDTKEEMLRVLEFDEMTTSTLTSESAGSGVSIPPNGSAVYWIDDGSDDRAVVRHDLETDDTRRRSDSSFTCSRWGNEGLGTDCTGIATGRDADDLYLTWSKSWKEGEYRGTVLYDWNFDENELTRLEPTVEVDGESIAVCGPRTTCTVHGTDGGRIRPGETFEHFEGDLRVRRIFEGSDGRKMKAIVDFEDGEQVTSRLYPAVPGESDDVAGNWNIRSAVGSSAEAALIQPGEESHIQYAIRDAARSSTPDAFQQRTFLDADHHHAAFRRDGTALYYFTRDPISGVQQLFRYRLR